MTILTGLRQYDVPPAAGGRAAPHARSALGALALMLALLVAPGSSAAARPATAAPTAEPSAAPTAEPSVGPDRAAVAPQAAATGAELPVLWPSELVFATTRGSGCTALQTVSVLSDGTGPVDWQLVSSASWLHANGSSGTTPSELTASVDCAGLSEGVHEATLTVRDAEGAGDSSTVVRVVVNPVSTVSVTTWKDGHRGAFSSSTDDGMSSGFSELVANGIAGTFVMNGTQPPWEYEEMFEAGMELGAHLASHPCYELDEASLRDEITENLDGVVQATGSYDAVTTLVWPCGFTTPEEQAIAAEYFLSARGYNINELEDTTPANMMNLRSFNSHEHEPFPPADLRSIVDAAEAQGRWANLVLHRQTNDDGAIAYATTKDVWVAPIGRVVSYILQRDRTVIAGVTQTSSSIRFDISRLSLPSSPVRSFEATVMPTDGVTFRVDLGTSSHVTEVTVGGVAVPFEVRDEPTGRAVYLTSSVSTAARSVVIGLSATAPAVLAVSADELVFSVVEGGSVAGQSFGVSNAGSGSLVWSASVVGAGWLSVSPASGSGAGTVGVVVEASGLGVGTHTGQVAVSAPGAVGSPQVVQVTVTVVPAGAQRWVFDYPDRAALVGDGWDFVARTASGAARDTEQVGGVQVAYGASGLGIPADVGDLWAGLNSTRNSVFRDLPASWTSAQVRLSFAPTQNYQQAGLVVYGDDDNYVQVTRIHGNGQSTVLAREVGGSAAVLASAATTATSGLLLRLERVVASGVITGSFSLDGGGQWQSLGSVTQSIADPRLGLIVTASPGGLPVATIHDVQITSAAG